MRLVLLPLSALLLGNAEMPPPIRAMLDAAYKSDDEREVATIVKYARLTAPEFADAIGREQDDWRAVRQANQQAALANASLFERWTGRAEVGGFISTGNSDVTGLSAIIDLQREGLSWRHKLRLQADYQQSGRVTSRERYLFGY